MRLKIIIISILILSALLRFVGTNPGYNSFHSDEGISYSSAASMITSLNLDPLRYDYPAGVPFINLLFFSLIFVPISWLSVLVSHFDQTYLFLMALPFIPLLFGLILRKKFGFVKVFLSIFWILLIISGILVISNAPIIGKEVLGKNWINALFWGRYVTAIFSLFVVFLTYKFASLYFDSKRVGIISAFFMALNYKSVVNSHIGLPDTYNAFFVLAGLIVFRNLLSKPSIRNFLLSGFLIAASFSIKYQVFLAFPFIFFVLILLINQKSWSERWMIIKKSFLSFFVFILSILIINPYHFIHFKDTLKAITEVSIKYATGTYHFNFYSFSYLYHWNYGAALSILCLFGIIFSIFRLRMKIIPVLLYLTPFIWAIVFYSVGGFYVRNFITITPLLMAFSAYTVFCIYLLMKKVANTYLATILSLALILVSVYFPGKNSLINSYFYTKEWNYDVAREWVKNNIPLGSAIAAHPFEFSTVVHSEEDIQSEFELKGNFSYQEHKDVGAQYIVMNFDRASGPFYYWMMTNWKRGGRLYWNKPISEMRNSFHGMAAEEIMRYRIFSAVKPWQAPDSGIVVSKMIPLPNTKMKLVKSYDFSKSDNGWVEASPYKIDGSLFRLKSGYFTSEIKGISYPGIRLISEPLEITPGKIYKFKVSVRSSKSLGPREREGFIGIKFIKKTDLSRAQLFDTVPVETSVSSRVYGTDKWMEKNVVAQAPEGASYAVLVFGVEDASKTEFSLQNANIYESDVATPDYLQNLKSYQDQNPIDLDLLYPNSHGNL